MEKIKGVIYEDPINGFKIRSRGEHRNLEVNYYYKPMCWESTGFRTLEESKKAILAKINGADDLSPKKRGNKPLTLGEYAKDFFTRTDPASLRAKNEAFNRIFEETYYKSNQGRLDNYILPKFGKYRLDSISDIEVENWYSTLGLKTKSKKASDGTKTKILHTFNIVMEHARKQKHITTNPIASVEKIVVQQEKEREPFAVEEIRILFPQNMEELLKIWGTLQWALFFSVMVDTGWRVGEISALRITDFRNGGVYSESSVDYATRQVKHRFKTTKKGQKYKVGILSEYTLWLFAEYLNQRESKDVYVFRIEETGNFNTPNTSNKHLRSALAKAGIDDRGRTEHCFRHSFDTFMLRNINENLEEKDVQELMAHTGYQKTYDHRTPDDIINRLKGVKPVIDRIRA